MTQRRRLARRSKARLIGTNRHRALGFCLSMISAQTCFVFGAGENRCTLFSDLLWFSRRLSFHLHGICRASPCGTGLSAALKPRPLAGFSPFRASIPDAKAGARPRISQRHAAPATDMALLQPTLRVRGLAGFGRDGLELRERLAAPVAKDPRCPDILARAPVRTGQAFMRKSPTTMGDTRMREVGVRHHSVNMSRLCAGRAATSSAQRSSPHHLLWTG